jgi:acyl-CoA synthetase (AMP-forming)/AMP-acid ligase II
MDLPGRPLGRLRVAIAHDTTLANLADRLAAAHGKAIAYEEAGSGDGPISYVAMADRIARFASVVAERIHAGDRVVVATPNGYDQLLVSLAVSRAGGLPAPVNAQMRDDEIEHVVDDAGASLVVRDVSELAGGAPLRWTASLPRRDVAALFYTSGTTGTPKGVELSHRALLASMPSLAAVPFGPLRGEAVVALPVAHIMGFGALLAFGCAGLPVYFLPRFRAEAVLDAIEQRRASVFIGVPAMYRMLLDAGAADRDLRSVRLFMAGADVMPPDLARTFQRFGASATLPLVGPVGGALFVEGYGLAESAGAVAVKISPPVGGGILPGDSLGVGVPGYRFRIVDEEGRTVPHGRTGELLVKGPGVTKGYWGNAAATGAVLTDDGWLRTGDLARQGPMGLLTFAGRAKDVIKHGGYSVYAVEVEEVLRRHPAVAEAAVVGLADARTGEVVAAGVRLAPGVDPQPTADELIEFCRSHLAPYKCPVRILFVDDLPRTGTVKVRKAALRTLFDSEGSA